jgi:molecular chaperone DnaK (HSP70)
LVRQWELDAEKAKIALSSDQMHRFEIDPGSEATTSHFSTLLTRAKFESMNAELFDKVPKLIDQVLAGARSTPNEHLRWASC